MRWSVVGNVAAVASLLLTQARVAQACGACFHPQAATPQTASTVVTGHRMALAYSPTRSVLWDQVKYSGSPEDFAWVLPVGPGAYVEQADDAWFEVLDGVTTTQVTSPSLLCAPTAGGANSGVSSRSSTGGCACVPFGSSSQDASGDEASGGAVPTAQTNPVTVEHEGTVGPYETVTLHSTQPKALEDWLTSHGYAVPAEMQPILDAYVSDGADFIALRLKPNASIRQMTPVRVITPGASPILPLRMVNGGTGAFVAITLFVISEGREAPQNFSETAVDLAGLWWDWRTQTSNFRDLRAKALSTGDGSNWLTAYASPSAFTRPVGPNVQLGGSAGTVAPTSTLADLYQAQAAFDARTPSCASVSSLLRRSDSVYDDSCPADADAGATDAGATCPQAGAGLPASSLVCNGHGDLAAALVGMHPNDVWITRLEANLPHAALANDLILRPADAQTAVSNVVTAQTSVNPPCTPAATGSVDTRPPPRSDAFRYLVACLVAMAFFIARRVTRPRRDSVSGAGDQPATRLALAPAHR